MYLIIAFVAEMKAKCEFFGNKLFYFESLWMDCQGNAENSNNEKMKRHL